MGLHLSSRLIYIYICVCVCVCVCVYVHLIISVKLLHSELLAMTSCRTCHYVKIINLVISWCVIRYVKLITVEGSCTIIVSCHSKCMALKDRQQLITPVLPWSQLNAHCVFVL